MVESNLQEKQELFGVYISMYCEGSEYEHSNRGSYFDIVLNSERRMGTMAKRKTLPKDFEQLVEAGNEQEIKNVFERCDINVYGGYNKGHR